MATNDTKQCVRQENLAKQCDRQENLAKQCDRQENLAKQCVRQENLAKQCVRQENLAKQCPWCQRWCLKDNACAYIFACGLDEKHTFHKGLGCGKSWCWKCGKKYCGQYYDPITGEKLLTAKDHHDALCCKQEVEFSEETYCGGGCSGHCVKRWS